MINKFVKFSSVGAIATLIQYLLLVLIIEYTAIDKTLASGISFIISAFANYYMNYHLTFTSQLRHFSVMPKFFVTASLGLTINILVFTFMLQIYDLYYIVAQVVATVIVLVWNFTISNIWVFKKKS